MQKLRITENVYDVWKAEKAGSGVDKILSGWKDTNWKLPNIEEKNRPDKVVLRMPLISILDDNIKEELVKTFGKQILNIEHNKILTLALALTENVISNERLRVTLNIHKYDITKMLKELCNDGYLISDGIGRGTTYRIKTDTNLASSDSNLATSDSNLATNLASSGLKERRKRRLSQSELFEIIIECASDWKSVEEISRSIDRNYQYIRNSIIPQMIEKGLLERRFPMPNHPNQQYKRTEKEE